MIHSVELFFYIFAQALSSFLLGYIAIAIAMMDDVRRESLDRVRQSLLLPSQDFGDLIYLVGSAGFVTVTSFAFWTLRRDENYATMWPAATLWYIMLALLAAWPWIAAYLAMFWASAFVIVLATACSAVNVWLFWWYGTWVSGVLCFVTTVWLAWLVWSNLYWIYADIGTHSGTAAAAARYARTNGLVRKTAKDLGRPATSVTDAGAFHALLAHDEHYHEHEHTQGRHPAAIPTSGSLRYVVATPGYAKGGGSSSH